MKKKSILITGITGQVAYYAAKIALEKGMKVVGTARHCTNLDDKLQDRKDIIMHEDFILDTLSLEDQASIDSILSIYKPDYIINTGAQAHVGKSWEIPEYTMNVTGLGVLRMLEGMKKYSKDSKMVQCSSSEMFGKYKTGIIDEKAPLCARSPYAVAKIAAHLMVDVYRESYGIKACCATFFNQESIKRGKEYFPKKITTEMKKILDGKVDKIKLGNLNFCRDWGFAGDYAEAIFLMLESDKCEDYVVATGKITTGEEFIRIAFKHANDKIGEEFFTFEDHIISDTDEFNRPNDVLYLRGDNSKIKEELGWTPTYDINMLIGSMVDFDVFGESK